MAKRLTKLGKSYGIVIDKPILELLKITPDTPLEFSTDGTRLVITPQRVDRGEADVGKAAPGRFIGVDEARKIAEEVMQKHADVLRKLAK